MHLKEALNQIDANLKKESQRELLVVCSHTTHEVHPAITIYKIELEEKELQLQSLLSTVQGRDNTILQRDHEIAILKKNAEALQEEIQLHR